MHRELGFNTIFYLKKISSLRECDTMSHLEEFQTNHTYLFKLIFENVFVLLSEIYRSFYPWPNFNINQIWKMLC